MLSLKNVHRPIESLLLRDRHLESAVKMFLALSGLRRRPAARAVTLIGIATVSTDLAGGGTLTSAHDRI